MLTNHAVHIDFEAPTSAPRPPEEPPVQVKLTRTGVWHRRAIGGATTACGLVAGGYAVRDDTYERELCPDCFSTFELSQQPPPDKRP